MTRMTRTTMGLMAGALTLALAASPNRPLAASPIDGEQGLLNRTPAANATEIQGGWAANGGQALQGSGVNSGGDAADPPARAAVSGTQALQGQY
jgi:hypothetical protein